MDHFISLDTAIAMTSLYRMKREEILKAVYQNQNILALSETFDRSQLDVLLERQGCAAIRIYYGMSEDLKVHAIIVGVDANNHDLLPIETSTASDSATGATDEEYILERGTRCPDICPDGYTPLNP